MTKVWEQKEIPQGGEYRRLDYKGIYRRKHHRQKVKNNFIENEYTFYHFEFWILVYNQLNNDILKPGVYGKGVYERWILLNIYVSIFELWTK